MLKIKTLKIDGYEKVVEAEDPECGLHAFIAIHSTALGPSLGGVRFYPYSTKKAALEDALRLAEAMSYKSALAETGTGGGKGVIIGNPHSHKTVPLLKSFAHVIHELKGAYIAAEDMGTTPVDMKVLKQITPYVAALPTSRSSGDPSRFTAFGILCGMKAVAYKLFGNDSLKGKKIALQGLGSVGAKLAYLLFWEETELIVCDLDDSKTALMAESYGAEIASSEDILFKPCDILAPCAFGGILNEKTIPLLRCKGIAGSANNQLATPQDGERLKKQGILQAPGYVINAGGLINATYEFEIEGYNPIKARNKPALIYEKLLTIFDKAFKENKNPHQVADEWAEHLISQRIGQRKHPLTFS